MHQLFSSLADDRERQFRRLVGISAALHLGLGILFWWSPFRPEVGTVLPAVVRVDLVTMADLAPALKPAPAAEPKPPPPPPPPPPKVAKVLPKQPAPLPKPKPKPKAAKPPPVPPKAEPKPKEEPKPPEPAPEQDLDDLLDQFRKERGETAPKPVEQAVVAPAGGPSGPGKLVSPEEMRWRRDVKMRMTRAWILQPGFRLLPLETKVSVQIGPTGKVLRTRVTQRSGNPWYDESVERAIQKASPLPVPPEADEWPFSFKPSDLQ